MRPPTLSFFRQPIPVTRRRSGPGFATPLTITEQYDDDPVVAVRLGHPLADRGFEFLMRDILQAAMAPPSLDRWGEWLLTPPTPDALERLLAPYADAFVIDHPAHPALQVRPAAARLAEAAAAKKPAGKRRSAPAGEEDEDGEEEDGQQPIATLLPDAPTGEAVKQDSDFFVRRGAVTAIGAGAILPVLYAHMVLFPPGGGGYLGLPHGADSIKFQMVGATLWETLWLNVLTRNAQGMGDAPWPAPADAGTFPWLDAGLADLPLGRRDPAAKRIMERARLHPAHIPMPRRYRLAPPEPGRCSLTGMDGPVFTGYSRWPQGLAYQPRGWWAPFAVRIDLVEKPAEPPRFLRARGPLRFDDWLETALRKEDTIIGKGATAKRRQPPPVLRQFLSAAETHPHIITALSQRTGTATTALAEGGALRVRACAQFLYGKAVGGMSQRELPVFHLPPEVRDWLGQETARTLERVGAMAGCLAAAARNAHRLGRREGAAAVADHLRNGLMAAMDGPVLDGIARLADAIRTTPEEQARFNAANRVRGDILAQARTTAIDLYDGAFPVTGTGAKDPLLAGERALLIVRLSVIFTTGTQ